MLDLIGAWWLLLTGPLMAVSVVVLLIQLMMRVTSPRTPADRTRWVSRALTCLAVAAIAYNVGVWEGRLFLLRGADDICGVARPEFLASDQALFPLRNVCIVRSGPSFDLVPWWVNPLVLAGLLGAVACVTVAVRARADDRGGGVISS